jgi:hypothetical protein
MARHICTPAACPQIWRACSRSLVPVLAVGSRLIREDRKDSVGSSQIAHALALKMFCPEGSAEGIFVLR